jgi:hypothetical protein
VAQSQIDHCRNSKTALSSQSHEISTPDTNVSLNFHISETPGISITKLD